MQWYTTTRLAKVQKRQPHSPAQLPQIPKCIAISNEAVCVPRICCPAMRLDDPAIIYIWGSRPNLGIFWPELGRGRRVSSPVWWHLCQKCTRVLARGLGGRSCIQCIAFSALHCHMQPRRFGMEGGTTGNAEGSIIVPICALFWTCFSGFPAEK